MTFFFQIGPTLMKYLSRYKDKIPREEFKKIAKKVPLCSFLL